MAQKPDETLLRADTFTNVPKVSRRTLTKEEREELAKQQAAETKEAEKLAKTARFIVDKPAAPTRVIEMVLEDKLSNHKTTHVRYLSRQPKTVPEAWLNPMYLARNPALE